MDVAVLLIDPNKIISSYEMPLALSGHTIVNIEDDVFMLIGGWNSSHTRSIFYKGQMDLPTSLGFTK